MALLFTADNLTQVMNAADIAEEVISEHFHLTSSHWSRHRYELRTGVELEGHEQCEGAFAQVLRYAVSRDEIRPTDFYRICVQDHNILAALGSKPAGFLFPLMAYVLTHELLHVVRFARFLQLFAAEDTDRDREESLVHRLTFELLEDKPLPNLREILKLYRSHHESHLPPLTIVEK